MIELIEIFFIFSFAVIAFSQYLRTSSFSVVNELRNNTRTYTDNFRILCGGDQEKLAKLINNEEYKQQTNILFSPECNVTHEGKWFYTLLIYLSSVIVFRSLYMFEFVHSFDLITIYISPHQNQLTGFYCITGLIINGLVFYSGWKAIKPRSIAKNAHSSLEQIYRTLTYTI